MTSSVYYEHNLLTLDLDLSNTHYTALDVSIGAMTSINGRDKCNLKRRGFKLLRNAIWLLSEKLRGQKKMGKVIVSGRNSLKELI